jgi:hypothetical protein
MPNPKISVIMVDGGFREAFHAVDFFCDQTLAPDDYELLWVEFYDRVDPQLSTNIAKYPNSRLITLGRSGPYHSSYCFNRGITEARGDLIVVPDGDIVVERDFLAGLLAEHEANERLVMYCYRYEELEADHVSGRLASLEHLRPVCVLTNPNNFGTCLSVRKRWLLDINGYDLHWVFHTPFHANGRDVYMRLKNLGLQVMWHPTLKCYHPWHPLTRFDARLEYGQQAIVTDWRNHHLHTLAFDGIDPARNAPFPEAQLRPALDALKARIQSEDEAAAADPSPVKRVVRRLKKSLGA